MAQGDNVNDIRLETVTEDIPGGAKGDDDIVKTGEVRHRFP